MKAMLAASRIPAIKDIKFPKLVSYKLDGYRCLMKNGDAYSRNDKLIANKHVQATLKALNMHGLDGELMLKSGDFESTQSAFSSVHGKPDFEFWVFDDFNSMHKTFKERSFKAKLQVDFLGNDVPVNLVTQYWVNGVDELDYRYHLALKNGYEGLILRDPNAPYKQGRATLNQQWMLKLKPRCDMEATVIGFKELEHNLDTETHKKDNMVGGGTLGSFICQDSNGNKFTVGTGKGFTQIKRQHYWDNKEKYMGRKLRVEYQNLTRNGLPRFPRFVGFRPEVDV